MPTSSQPMPSSKGRALRRATVRQVPARKGTRTTNEPDEINDEKQTRISQFLSATRKARPEMASAPRKNLYGASLSPEMTRELQRSPSTAAVSKRRKALPLSSTRTSKPRIVESLDALANLKVLSKEVGESVLATTEEEQEKEEYPDNGKSDDRPIEDGFNRAHHETNASLDRRYKTVEDDEGISVSLANIGPVDVPANESCLAQSTEEILEGPAESDSEPPEFEEEIEKYPVSVRPLVDKALEIPAYQRFSQSIGRQSVASKLPASWQFFDRLLHALNGLCMVSEGRNQLPVFHRVQRALETSMCRSLDIRHIQQLNWLVPELFRFEKVRTIWQGKRIDSFTIQMAESTTVHEREKMKGEVLMERRDILGQALLAASKVYKTPEEMPLKAILSDCSDLSKIQKPQIDHLEALSGKTVHLELPPGHSSSPFPLSSTEKQESLLGRIRKKQAIASADKLSGATEKARRLGLLSALPEFCDTLAFLFASAHKSTLLLGDVVSRLIQSSKMPITEDEVIERLKLVEEIAPNWCRLVKTLALSSVKIEKSVPLREIKEKIRNACESIV